LYQQTHASELNININRSYLPVFKDGVHLPKLPQFVHIDFVTSVEELVAWLENYRKAAGIVPTLLEDKQRFEKLALLYKDRLFIKHLIQVISGT
jgi:hypothetical protein